MEINYFDIAVVIILLFFTVRGALRGVIDELTGLVSIVAGFFFARQYSAQVAEHLQAFLPEQWLIPAAFALIFFVCIVVVALLGYFLKAILNALFVGFLNNLFGLIVGFLKGYVICICIAYLFLLFFGGHEIANSAYTMPYLKYGIEWLDQNIPL